MNHMNDAGADLRVCPDPSLSTRVDTRIPVTAPALLYLLHPCSRTPTKPYRNNNKGFLVFSIIFAVKLPSKMSRNRL